MEPKFCHALGFRDALAHVCMITRMNGPHAAVREVAEMLLKSDPDHCHAKVVLEMIDVDEREQRRKAWRKKRKKSK
ncbi:hypothetical protein [Methanoregula sp.]|uniref:hypothetical protein n=1 Tax=Methanoregula sp. TaxID=2052170 RepID=UPI003568FFD9